MKQEDRRLKPARSKELDRGRLEPATSEELDRGVGIVRGEFADPGDISRIVGGQDASPGDYPYYGTKLFNG